MARPPRLTVEEVSRMGIKGGLLTLLRCLFDAVSVTVSIGGQMSRKIPVGRGLFRARCYHRCSSACL